MSDNAYIPQFSNPLTPVTIDEVREYGRLLATDGETWFYQTAVRGQVSLDCVIVDPNLQEILRFETGAERARRAERRKKE